MLPPTKLATFGAGKASEADAPDTRADQRKKRRKGSAVDKSVLALPTPRRIRDRDHVKSVAKQPCLICGRSPADAHHLRFAQSLALGRKVSDEFTVPLVVSFMRYRQSIGVNRRSERDAFGM